MSEPTTSSFRAQHGEDRILAHEFAENSGGYFVEVGSFNGESFSNTYYLEKAMGWTGLLIEADPQLHEHGCKVRPRSVSVNCAAVAPGAPSTVSFEIVDGCQWVSSLSVSQSMLKRIEDIPVTIRKVMVPARTLDTILSEVHAPEKIDVLTIDVEGHEWPVLQGFTPEKWKPAVIILERNSHFPESNIMRFMHAHGYGWRRTTGCNDWFYAGVASHRGYHARLATLYYLPKYLTIWKPLLADPAKRAVKYVLRKARLLDVARAVLKGAPKTKPADASQLTQTAVRAPANHPVAQLAAGSGLGTGS